MKTQIIPFETLRGGQPGPMPFVFDQKAPFALARAFDEGPAVRNVAVWGTGACARELLPLLSPEVDVVAFVDNRASSWGQSFSGVTIVAPSALSTIAYDRLIIASEAVAPISRDLVGLGLLDQRVTQYTGRHDGWRIASLLAKPVFATLQVGITTRCNLMCLHCPRDTDESVYSDLPLERFERYLASFDPWQFGNLLVSDFGEVTIVKSFLSYLRAASARGWRHVEFVTNATNGKADLWDTIFREGLVQKLVISLEGTGEVFESVRGFSWTRFAANVKTITDANARYGSRAKVVLNAVCMRSNLTALPDVVDFAADHGAALSFVHLNPSNQFNNPLGQYSNHLDQAPRADVVATVVEITRRAAVRGIQVMLPEAFPELDAPAESSTSAVPPEPAALRCYQPLRWVEIDAQGNVFPCCQMAKRHAVGTLESSTFEEVWEGEGYRGLLDGLKPDGVPIDVCRTCNMYNGKNF